MISQGVCQLLCGHEINCGGREHAPGGGAPWDASGCLKEKWIYAEDNSWNRCETKYFISQSCPHPFWKGNEIAGLTCSSSDHALFLSKKSHDQGRFHFLLLPSYSNEGRAQQGRSSFSYALQAPGAWGWWLERQAGQWWQAKGQHELLPPKPSWISPSTCHQEAFFCKCNERFRILINSSIWGEREIRISLSLGLREKSTHRLKSGSLFFFPFGHKTQGLWKR